MKDQITIRGLGADLEVRLLALARERRMSLNKAALSLMRKGAGLRPEQEGPEGIGGGLDVFVGSWSGEDEGALLEAVNELDQADGDFWH